MPSVPSKRDTFYHIPENGLEIMFNTDSNKTLTGKIFLGSLHTTTEHPDQSSKMTDENGATMYTVAVIMVYGLSIAFLIGSQTCMRRKKRNDTDEMRSVNKYLDQQTELQDQSKKDSFRKLKMSIIPLLTIGIGQDVSEVLRTPTETKSFPAFYPLPLNTPLRNGTSVDSATDDHVTRGRLRSTLSDAEESDSEVYPLSPTDTAISSLPTSPNSDPPMSPFDYYTLSSIQSDEFGSDLEDSCNFSASKNIIFANLAEANSRKAAESPKLNPFFNSNRFPVHHISDPASIPTAIDSSKEQIVYSNTAKAELAGEVSGLKYTLPEKDSDNNPTTRNDSDRLVDKFINQDKFTITTV